MPNEPSTPTTPNSHSSSSSPHSQNNPNNNSTHLQPRKKSTASDILTSLTLEDLNHKLRLYRQKERQQEELEAAAAKNHMPPSGRNNHNMSQSARRHQEQVHATLSHSPTNNNYHHNRTQSAEGWRSLRSSTDSISPSSSSSAAAEKNITKRKSPTPGSDNNRRRRRIELVGTDESLEGLQMNIDAEESNHDAETGPSTTGTSGSILSPSLPEVQDEEKYQNQRDSSDRATNGRPQVHRYDVNHTERQSSNNRSPRRGQQDGKSLSDTPQAASTMPPIGTVSTISPLDSEYSAGGDASPATVTKPLSSPLVVNTTRPNPKTLATSTTPGGASRRSTSPRPQSEILDQIRQQKKKKKSFFLNRLKSSMGIKTSPADDPSNKKKNVRTLSDIKKLKVDDFTEIQTDPLKRPLPPLSTTSIIHFENENQLRTKVLTWNMDGRLPADDDVEDFKKFLEPGVHHIYAIGTQQCERGSLSSFFIQSKVEWEQLTCELLGSDYVALASSTLLSIHLIIFVRKDLIPWISRLHTSQVAAGFLNELGNRGAVSVSFFIGNTSFIFINAHLPDGQDETVRRNHAYEKIVDLIEYKGKTEHGDLFRDVNRIFFFGDLNYRVNGNRGIIDTLLTQGIMHIMLQNDQLNLMRAKGRAFEKFFEKAIEFKPTYQFALERNVYDDGEKQVIPSWTDRILWVPNNDNISQLSYEACFKIRCSSHRPVAARFLVAVDVKLYKPLSESARAQPLLATSHTCNIQ